MISFSLQILSVRLFQTVLQFWDMDNPEIPSLLEQILAILGRIILTCSYDTGNKPLYESKSLVLLTQSHSSTLAQEIITLLRILHGILGWNQALNAIFIQKLTLAMNLLNEGSFISTNIEGQTLDHQQLIVIACLNVIGGWDMRPRIGALVEIDSELGTIIRVTQKGKLCVRIHDSSEIKKVTLTGLKLIEQPTFLLDKMPLNEHLVKIFGAMILNKQSTYLNNSERKSVYGKIFLFVKMYENLSFNVLIIK